MQVRPLHMVAVKGKFLPMLYGHNIGLQSKPIITISSHKTTRDQVVWYCGGQIAEDGVNKSSTEQLAAFKELLNSIFPWLDFNDPDYAWGSFNINRAEHLQPNGKKPDNATWFALNNVIFAWPTKLVLAPAMANDIFGSLQKNLSLNLQDKSSNVNVDFLGKLPKPMIAKPWWASL